MPKEPTGTIRDGDEGKPIPSYYILLLCCGQNNSRCALEFLHRAKPMESTVRTWVGVGWEERSLRGSFVGRRTEEYRNIERQDRGNSTTGVY